MPCSSRKRQGASAHEELLCRLVAVQRRLRSSRAFRNDVVEVGVLLEAQLIIRLHWFKPLGRLFPRAVLRRARRRGRTDRSPVEDFGDLLALRQVILPEEWTAAVEDREQMPVPIDAGGIVRVVPLNSTSTLALTWAGFLRCSHQNTAKNCEGVFVMQRDGCMPNMFRKANVERRVVEV